MRRKLLHLMTALLISTGLFAQNPNPIGVEFLVNTTETYEQKNPTIDVNSNGDFVIAWGDNTGNIHAQMYDNTYSKVGSEFHVNTIGDYNTLLPRVSMFEDGSFVIMWRTTNQGSRFRTYDASGSPITGEVSLGSSYGSGIDTDGDSLIIITYNVVGDQVKARRYNKDGSSYGNQINVSEDASATYRPASVAMLSDGSFVIAYNKSYEPEVLHKRFNSNGVPLAPEALAFDNPSGSGYYGDIKIEINSDGDYLISSVLTVGSHWRSFDFRIFDISGAAQIIRSRVFGESNITVLGTNGAINENGNTAFAWGRRPNQPTGTPTDVHSRLFSEDTAMDDDFITSTITSGEQRSPKVVFMPDGTLFYVWNGNGFVGDSDGIYAIRYEVPAFPCTSAEAPTLSAGTTICSGQSTTLSVTDGALNDAGNWKWYSESCGGTLVGTGTSISISPTSTTTYYARGEGACASGNCASVTINVISGPTVSASGTATLCVGQSTILTASGANSYTWNNSAGSGSIVSVAPNETTVYTVTGTDNNGCQNTAQVAITVNEIPDVTASGATAICTGETVSLTASGADSYIWNNGLGSDASVSVSPMSTTTYTLTGTDNNGCQNTDQITVSVNQLPTVVASSDASTICEGAMTNLSVSGANIYSWDNGLGAVTSASVSPSLTTIYSVTGVDANGCQNTDQITIAVNPLPNVVANGDATICEGTATTLSGMGANTYAWDNAIGSGVSVSVAPSSTTTYTLIGTDTNGCQNTDQVTVAINPLPVVVVSGVNTICEGSTATLSASGANSYTWDNGIGAGSSAMVSPTTTTTYTLIGTDGNGCQNTDQISINVNELPNVVAGGITTICEGNEINLSASGANTYDWNNGGGSGAIVAVSPTSTTTYTLTGTDSNGCQNTDQITIAVNPLPNVIGGGTATICEGSNTVLTASGAGTFSWDNGEGSESSITVSPWSTTTYTLTGTDDNGCQNTDEVTVFVNPNPIVSISGTVDICAGETTTLSAGGVGSFTWDNNAGEGAIVSVSPDETTTYSVTVTDGNMCSNSTQITVWVDPLPTIEVSGITEICEGISTGLTATGANSYVWDNGAGSGSTVSVSPDETTTYTVTGTSGFADCSNSTQVTVFVNPLPIVEASGAIVICEGETTTLSASGANAYAWDNGAGNNASVLVSPTSTTTYSVTGTDSNACTNTSQVMVTVNPLPNVSVDHTDNALTAQNTNTGVSYQWVDCNTDFTALTDEVDSEYMITQSGDFAVVISENGCTDTSSCFTGVVVGVDENIIAHQVSIYPNPSPGKINIDLGSLTNVAIRIMSLNGQMIYEKQQINSPIHSLDLNEAAGVYFVEIKAQNEIQYFKLIVE